MAFDNLDTDITPEVEEEDEGGIPPEEGSNRTFLIVAGILGGVMVLSIICLGLFILLKPSGKDGKEASQIETQNAANAFSATKTSEAAKWTPTATLTRTATPVTPSPTASPVPAVTDTPLIHEPKATLTEGGPNESTVEALNTQVAATKAGKATATSTAKPVGTLPSGGFADQVGAPGLLGLAIVLVVVIFLARRLRASSS
jgi:hypothetical protein